MTTYTRGNPEYRRLVADRIKSARVAAGYSSAREAAEAMPDKLGRGTWQNWECAVRCPTPETMIDVARVLRVNEAYLFGYTDDPAQELYKRRNNKVRLDFTAEYTVSEYQYTGNHQTN